jgi:branched-chain amino acid transport system substrate-binding protein
MYRRMGRCPRTAAAAIAALTAISTLAACGSHSNAGGGGSQARGVSDTEIRIAGDATLTFGSVPNAVFEGLDAGAKARYFAVNKDGGIYGRKINYLGTSDDSGAAPTLIQNLSKQILTQNVFAIAPYISAAGFPESFIDSNKVPAFGLVETSEQCANKWMFPWGGCTANADYGQTSGAAVLAQAITGQSPDPETGALKVTDGDEWAVQGTAPLATYVPPIVAGAKATGWTTCYSDASVPATGAADYSPYAAKVMRDCNHGAGPQGLYVSLSTAAQTAAYISTLRALGWKGVAETGSYDPVALKSPDVAAGLAGSVTSFGDLSLPGADGGPVFKDIRAALDGIGDADVPVNSGVMTGWAMADMVIQALEHAGKNLTLDGFQSALQNWTYPGISGFTPPISYPEARQYPVPCWNVLRVVRDEYKEAFPMTCGQVIDIKTGDVVKGGFKS